MTLYCVQDTWALRGAKMHALTALDAAEIGHHQFYQVCFGCHLVWSFSLRTNFQVGFEQGV